MSTVFGKDDHVKLQEMEDANLDGAEAVITEVYKVDDMIRYGLYIQDYGEFAWAKNENMELIDRNRVDLIEEWEAE